MKIKKEDQARLIGLFLIFFGFFGLYYQPLKTNGIITIFSIIGGCYLFFTGKFIGSDKKKSKK